MKNLWHLMKSKQNSEMMELMNYDDFGNKDAQMI